MSDTIEVFISYSKQDKELRDGLLAHLRPLEREGIIIWHDRQILPGTEWDEEIKTRLNAADIILLLISADFLATDYCTQVEIPEALRRHEAGEATVMPVILRSCGWKYTPLTKIQAYPEKAKPVVSWAYVDEAYTNVVDGVYLAATKIRERRSKQQAKQECIQQEQLQVEDQERLHQAEHLRQQQPAEAARFEQQELERQQQVQLKQEADEKQQELPNHQKQPIDSNNLSLDRNIDYTRLEKFLKEGNWQEADKETFSKIHEVMGRQPCGWLRVEDIEKFPCPELHMIDQLWVKYSRGRFGFSVQTKIWQKHGSPREYNYKWERFGAEIGWRTKGIVGFGSKWKEISELTYDISAPQGHLPGCIWRKGNRSLFLWGNTVYIFFLAKRLIECVQASPN